MADAGLTLGKPLGHAKITDLSAAVGLTAPDGARLAFLKAETQTVRWRDDGTDPTASVGMQMLTTDPAFIYSGDLSAIKFIQTSASAALSVAFYA